MLKPLDVMFNRIVDKKKFKEDERKKALIELKLSYFDLPKHEQPKVLSWINKNGNVKAPQLDQE